MVGLDIGPFTIAIVSETQARLERFCDELEDKHKAIRKLQRKLDRSRRANHPENFNAEGTVKADRQEWHHSQRYLHTRAQLADPTGTLRPQA